MSSGPTLAFSMSGECEALSLKTGESSILIVSFPGFLFLFASRIAAANIRFQTTRFKKISFSVLCYKEKVPEGHCHLWLSIETVMSSGAEFAKRTITTTERDI